MLQDHFNATGVTDTEMQLYDLLLERTPEMNISHKTIPTLEEHCKFVRSLPYPFWYLIQLQIPGRPMITVGSVYLTDRREMGIFIFKKHRRQGYARKAIELLLDKHPGDILANINPNNTRSIKFFEELGAKHIQNTYEICSGD